MALASLGSVAAQVSAWDLRLWNRPGPMLPGSPRPATVDEFPLGILPITVEMLLGTSWVNITPYVHQRDGIRVSRGRANEAGQVDRSTLNLTVKNQDGRFSTRNPLGPWFGLFGRNTQLRTSVNLGRTRLVLSGESDDYVFADDSPGISVTGDLDIRVELYADTWSPTNVEQADLIGKYHGQTNQRSWAVDIVYDVPRLTWSADGTAIRTEQTIGAPIRPSHGRIALRVTLDVDNGAGGTTVTFYTSDRIDGEWTQLGNPRTTAGTLSVFDSTAPLVIGNNPGTVNDTFNKRWQVYRAEVRSGIGAAGTVVANPDFTGWPDGTTAFLDGAGVWWRVAGGAQITNRRYRVTGEISALPQQWDPSGKDVYIPIEAAGILRRLTQGSAPTNSPYYRAVTRLSTSTTGSTRTPVAYWPCEDLAGSSGIASALGGPPMAVNGTPTYKGFTGFVCSDGLPLLQSSRWVGTVPTYTSTGQNQIRFLLAVPTGGTTNGAVICRLSCAGTAVRWELVYATTGDLTLNAYDGDSVSILASSSMNANVDGRLVRISIELKQNGANVDWEYSFIEVSTSSASSNSGTVAGQTASRITRVDMSPGGQMADVAIGHIYVQSEVTIFSELAGVFDNALNAYVGEPAGNRIERLCREESITFRSMGNLAATFGGTPAMGVQGIDTFVNLLRECERVDMGILLELRDAVGLAYRPRESLYNQPRRLIYDYASQELSGIDPTDDDQPIRNDWTVERSGGSSARFVLEAGPLSVQAPPNGVSRYDDSVTISQQTDVGLLDQASWRVHLGTVDESRFPNIGVHLSRVQWSTAGNLWAPGTFEAGTESWAAGGSVPPTLSRDYTRSHGGGWSLKAVWGTGGVLPQFGKDVSGFVVGVPVTLRAWVNVPAGSPAVLLAVAGGVTGSASITNDLWEEITLTFTPTASTHGIQVWPNVAPTSGDAVYVDDGIIPADLRGDVLDQDVGDRLVILNPPAWLPPEDISQLTQGFSEFFDQKVYELTANCSPESAWRVGVYGAADRYSSEGSTLADQALTSDLTLSVATPTGPLWTTDAGQMPIDLMVGGERMFVTAISGASSPQTFTVRRSINGILKYHPIGTKVALFQPAVYAL